MYMKLTFSTGFELTVPRSDFEEYGGGFYAVEDGDGTLTWTNMILDMLIHLLEDLAYLDDAGECDVTRYESSGDGTRNLWSDLMGDGRSVKYATGVVIFHQLLYQTPLTATKLTAQGGQ
jgi:hypothetical protein